MKKHVQLLIALAVLVVLIGLVFLLERDPYEAPEKPDFANLIPAREEGSLDKIQVTNNEGSITVEKRGEQYWITEPKEMKANESSLKTAFKTLEEMAVVDLASKKKDRQKTYGIAKGESDYLEIKAFAKGQEILNFAAGKRSPDYKGQFIRLASKPDDVYVTDKAMPWLFKREVKEWRSKTLVELPREEISKLEWTTKEGTMVLEKGEDQTWTRAGETNWYADGARLNNLLGVISKFNWAEIFDEANAATDYGFEKPQAVVKATAKDKSIVLTFGKDLEEPKGNVWVKLEGDGKVYQARKYQLEKFTKEFSYYKGEKPQPTAPDAPAMPSMPPAAP